MQQITAADRAAFSTANGIEIANHIVDGANLRVPAERRRGRGAGRGAAGLSGLISVPLAAR